MVRECRLSSLRFATLANLLLHFLKDINALARSAYLTVTDDEFPLHHLGQVLIMMDGSLLNKMERSYIVFVKRDIMFD